MPDLNKKVRLGDPIKLRVYKSDHNEIVRIAREECRTVTDQYRFAIREWTLSRKGIKNGSNNES
jgi:hypothetical protein